MSLIAHYKLNDNLATTNVVASVGSNGSLVGGDNTQDLSESGKINRAMHFDGSSDYVDISTAPLDKDYASAQGSICCWAKNDSSSPAGYQYIIGRNAAGTNEGDIAIYLNDNTNKIGGIIESSGSTSSATANSVLSDTNWHHYIFTWSSTQTAFYVDGVKQTTTGAGKTLVANASLGFAIGSRSNAGAIQCWDGLIDDVRIYDHVLSTFEIAFIYNSGNGSEDEVYDTATITENLNISDSEVLQTNPEQIAITENLDISDDIITTIPWIPTYYSSKILSYNPLIYVTNTNPANIVHVDISIPESPSNHVYELTGVSNANSVVYNSTNGYIYAIADNGQVVKVLASNLNNQTIIDTLDSDNLEMGALVSDEFKLFVGTDDEDGELILIDEAELESLSLDIRFLSLQTESLNLQIDFISAESISTDIRFLAVNTESIGLDIRFLSRSYDTISQYPISSSDWQLKINNVDMLPLKDVDMDSIVINHFDDNKSTASFILHRVHDKLDYRNDGVASQITNNNEVKIYIDGTLEFDGKISTIDVQSETETVNVTAKMLTPDFAKHTVKIPLASVNEQLNLYHCLIDDINIDNPVIFENEETPEFYKGVMIDLGTLIQENVKRYISFTNVADEIKEGSFQPTPNWEYFWRCAIKNFVTGSITNSRYIGTSISPISSDTLDMITASCSYQRIYDDSETELGYYYVGLPPYLEVSATNGRKIVKDRWEDREDGLYRVQNDSYDYREYCQLYAQNEYNKITNINGDILPLTSANIKLTLSAYYFYNIKLLTRINLTNTTTSNIYNKNNGFPIAVKSITITSRDMSVVLNCNNAKSQDELDELDASLPNISNYERSGFAVKQFLKFNPLTGGNIV